MAPLVAEIVAGELGVTVRQTDNPFSPRGRVRPRRDLVQVLEGLDDSIREFLLDVVDPNGFIPYRRHHDLSTAVATLLRLILTRASS
jgi:hypothetical protein